MLPKLDTDNFEFAKYENGKINYNKVISKKTGEISKINNSIYGLTKNCNDVDKEIYDIFYGEASRYVHTDILSAKRYFSTYDPYDEINPTYISILILFTLGFMLLDEMINNKKVKKQFGKDAKHYLTKSINELIKCFDIISQDIKNYNKLYRIFSKRSKLMIK